jgi:Ni/Co efflux regulator RcnB
MKKFLMILTLAAFCFSASAVEVPQQDSTKTSQDTTKKQMKKKSATKTKGMKKKGTTKKGSKTNEDRKTDTTTRPVHK